MSALARAEVVDAELRTTLFLEPSSSSDLTVISPSASLSVRPSEEVSLQAGYEADIVSGATEAVKAGPIAGVDVVSAATRFDDTRHVVNGALGITRETTELTLGYGYGTESDYRSHALSVTAGTSFLQHNTELVLSYARGFDRVCTSAFTASDAPSTRVPLDSSKGCFTQAKDRSSRQIAIDTLQAAWTQAWTPVFTTQAQLTGGLQHGFLGNPYRAVVIAPAGDAALENHPENRARAAFSLRGRYYIQGPDVVIGAAARLYRDTWDLSGQTYELELERELGPSLRAALRGRYYTQSAALFFSDDYTGGEPLDGPRGRYWSGDRELSPLQSWMLGGRLLFVERSAANRRLLGALLALSASLGADVMKTELERFTWSGKAPDDTLALLASLGLSGEF